MREGKIVDFAIAIKPLHSKLKGDKKAARKIDLLRAELPLCSINYTNYKLLIQSPVSISVETKPDGSGRPCSTLQVVTWQRAQWKQLLRIDRPIGQPLYFGAHGNVVLPILFVHDCQWSFAATAVEDGKVVLYHGDAKLGSTNTAYGVYKEEGSS